MYRSTMMSLLFTLSSFTAQAATPAAGAPASSETRSPESSFLLPGGFSQRTTVAELRALYGASNVKIVEMPATDDAKSSRSLVLFPDDPTRRAYVGFHDDESLTGVRSILVKDRDSRWRGKRGVHVGMSFARLRELNGKPFGFSGFDGQKRGWAQDQWSPALDDDDGTLGALDVEEGEHMYFGVELGIRDQAKDASDDAWPHDESVRSDDPRFPRLAEIVEVTALEATTSLDDEWE